MNIIKKIKQRLYYKFANKILKTEPVKLPDSYSFKKNLFIYFDYEREFGNNYANISDEEIKQILDVLSQNKIQTTWFTVGKILKYYPNTITDILNHKHEIASHTYHHISPYKKSNKILKKDFELFSIHSANFTNIKGFHSPQGKWNFKMFKYLIQNNYKYDLTSINNNNNGTPLVINYNKCRMLRFATLGDDWQFFNSNKSENEIFQFFTNLIEPISCGQVLGVGFHPWILFSNKNIYNGFLKFINSISNQKDFRIKSLSHYVNDILNTNT